MSFRASPAAVDIATRLIALDLGLHPSHVLIDMGNGSTVIAQVIVTGPAQHRSWRDDHGGMILTRTRALLMAIQDDHTDLALRRRALKRAITRALEETPRVTTGRADHVHYEVPEPGAVTPIPPTEEWMWRNYPGRADQELGAVVVKCAYPAPHPRHRHMGRNRTAIWCPGVPRVPRVPEPPARCGAVNPDYPGEYACTLDAGHPVPIRLPEDEDVIDHANPERGAYWSGWTEADYFPTPPTEEWKQELGADVADSSDPEEFYAPLASYTVEELATYLATRMENDPRDPADLLSDVRMEQAGNRQTCTACHGTGEMHDLSHGVMACDRCNGEGVTHEPPILATEEEGHRGTDGSLACWCGAPDIAHDHGGRLEPTAEPCPQGPEEPSSPTPHAHEEPLELGAEVGSPEKSADALSHLAREASWVTDEELFEYLGGRLATRGVRLTMTPLQSPEKAPQSEAEPEPDFLTSAQVAYERLNLAAEGWEFLRALSKAVRDDLAPKERDRGDFDD